MGIRFKLAELLLEKEREERRSIPWKEMADQTGISVSVLSNLASRTRRHNTNTRYVYQLMKYFGCRSFDQLMEMEDEGEGRPEP
jgi:hypothetical protein